MNSHLSPKDLALVIGVSESSLKRWVDEGRLEAARTVGGHRRIAMHDAVRFIRETGAMVVRPDLLGMPDLTDGPVTTVANGGAETALQSALQAGKAVQARGIILAQYLDSRSVAGVCDGLITHAMHRIGELWRHSEQGITIEHRALGICIEAMHQIRQLLPPAPESAPVAVGGALESDPYTLPTLMAATCCLEMGIRDINLGPDTPVDSLLDAARTSKARFIWLSVSVVGEKVNLVERIQRLAEGAAAIGASVLLGGRAVYGLSLPPMKSTHMIHSMAELGSFARSALAGTPPARSASNGAVGSPGRIDFPLARAAAARPLK